MYIFGLKVWSNDECITTLIPFFITVKAGKQLWN